MQGENARRCIRCDRGCTHCALVSFRHRPEGVVDEDSLNGVNRDLLDRPNRSGKLSLTRTVLSGRYTLRLSIGQTSTTREHVRRTLREILDAAQGVRSSL